MPGLFINYRRSDSAGWAGRLHDHLEMRFGRTLVWQDVDEIQPGARWLEEIMTAVREADSVLVIIGPRWLELGGARLMQADDVLRQEVEVALASHAAVVPVLVGGARMPAETDLPASLRGLSGRQNVSLLDNDWQHSVQVLVDALRENLVKSKDKVPLQLVLEKLFPMQEQFFDLLGPQPQAALQLADDALVILDRELPRHPQDAYLQLLRAYFNKNEAQALSSLGNSAASEQALERAERGFQTMCDELEVQLAGAYNGMGSVFAERGDFASALAFIDRALALQPDYAAALQDREAVLSAMSPQDQVP
jgi:tetratricopeptide (TPR) repeat protein